MHYMLLQLDTINNQVCDTILCSTPTSSPASPSNANQRLPGGMETLETFAFSEGVLLVVNSRL